MIGEYLESVKTELDTKFSSQFNWNLHIVDDGFDPRVLDEDMSGDLKTLGWLEAVAGSPVPDDKRVVNDERVLLLETETILRLERSISQNPTENPHTAMMTEGAMVLNFIKDASFAYQANICDPGTVSSEIDLMNVGLSIVTVRWNAEVVSEWPEEIAAPRITGVHLDITAQYPQIQI